MNKCDIAYRWGGGGGMHHIFAVGISDCEHGMCSTAGTGLYVETAEPDGQRGRAASEYVVCRCVI